MRYEMRRDEMKCGRVRQVETVRADHWVRLEMVTLFVVLWMPVMCFCECLAIEIELSVGD